MKCQIKILVKCHFYKKAKHQSCEALCLDRKHTLFLFKKEVSVYLFQIFIVYFFNLQVTVKLYVDQNMI